MAYEWTQIGYWNTPNLSWTIYIMLVVGLGFFGIDHLYMRSPFTAFLKLIVNILTLGFWYLYDVIGAFAETDVTKKYGVTTPFAPTGGLGAGMFSDKPDVKHAPWKFMGYSLTSGFPFGLFGLNNLVIGDTKGAIIKFWMTGMFAFPLIFFFPLTWVIAIGAAMYGMYVLFFKTETIFSKGPPSLFGRFASDMGPGGGISEADGVGFFGGIFKRLFSMFSALPIVGPMIKRAEQQIDMAVAGAKIVKASTIDVALAGADAVKTLAVDVPGEAVKAVGLINDGIQQKIQSLPSPTAALKKDLFGLPDLPVGPPGMMQMPLTKKSLTSGIKKDLFGLPDLPAGPPGAAQPSMSGIKKGLFGLPDLPAGPPGVASRIPMQIPYANPVPAQMNVINPLQSVGAMASAPPMHTGTLVGGGGDAMNSIASMSLMGVLYGGLVIAVGNLLYRQYKKMQEDKEGLEVEDKKTGSRHQSGLSDVPPKA